MNRREFLQTLTAGTSLALAPRVLAAVPDQPVTELPQAFMVLSNCYVCRDSHHTAMIWLCAHREAQPPAWAIQPVQLPTPALVEFTRGPWKLRAQFEAKESANIYGAKLLIPDWDIGLAYPFDNGLTYLNSGWKLDVETTRTPC